jgi:hypothetical protein
LKGKRLWGDELDQVRDTIAIRIVLGAVEGWVWWEICGAPFGIGFGIGCGVERVNLGWRQSAAVNAEVIDLAAAGQPS